MKNNSQPLPIYKLLLILTLGLSGSLYAEDPEFEPVHWAYSSFFGTGWYNVADNRSVFVMRIPPRQTLRKSGFSNSGERQTGIEIRYPLTVGMHNIDDLPGIIESSNFGTASFTPGVEFEIPVNDKWYLRPFVHVGWGTEFDTRDSAWIYYAGVKSRLQIPAGKFGWSLLGGLYYGGFTPDHGRSDRLASAQFGVEFTQPLSNVQIAGRAMDLNYNFMYSFLGKDLHFGLPDGNFDPVQDQYEAGVAMSFRNRPYRLWFFDVYRVGLGYKFSSEGNFQAVTFSIRSWFTK
jgi:hypothetical protein